MKISELIKLLENHKEVYGDVKLITNGEHGSRGEHYVNVNILYECCVIPSDEWAGGYHIIVEDDEESYPEREQVAFLGGDW